ncbi:MAG TPA: O-antigen ligase family protein [Verrucomicrobiae bacterium]|nr:O-antigen ligase family protein [Verrucomicrobiae bacterium]
MADENIPPLNEPPAAAKLRRSHRPMFALRAADVQLYRICDDLSGVLIFAMVVFSPWAFGSTQPWAVWVMNIAGYALGILLLAKLFIREAKGYSAMRWKIPSTRSGAHPNQEQTSARLITRTLAGLTLLILGYCLASALNAGATYNSETRLFEYHSYLRWLPHSFDRDRTWFIFWMYLGLAGSFWAIRDWLSGMTPDEARIERSRTESDSGIPAPRLPSRLRWLIWLLCLNGALLGVEAIAQRAAGSSKLLFWVQPQVNPEGETQFGPYAYRSNAAQYFNLLWPLCLGFWWTVQRGGGRRFGLHHVLLLCAAIMAACPIISTSRGGALVSAGILVVAVMYLVATNLLSLASRSNPDRGGSRTTWLLALFFAVVLGLGWYFGWDLLGPRMEQIGAGFSNREEMFAAARPMAKDYPVFGTGPGTFATVFQLYRISNTTYWPEQLHNDWLETRITFGWFGMGLVLAALGCILWRRFVPGRIRTGRRFVVLAWLGLAGCLVHARFDFPLQIHSILLLFLILCAILFTVSGRSSHR